MNIRDEAVETIGRLMICKHCGAEVLFEKTNEHTKTHK
jgi:hypothetical protein